jgi:Trk K+ transport system NAD-binding subunit
MPSRGALIGAILRNGEAIFPHGTDALRPGDRVIVFTETARALEVERAL